MLLLVLYENLYVLCLFVLFFVLFYFFNVGIKVFSEVFSFEVLGLGIVIILVVLLLCIGVVWL